MKRNLSIWRNMKAFEGKPHQIICFRLEKINTVVEFQELDSCWWVSSTTFDIPNFVYQFHFRKGALKVIHFVNSFCIVFSLWKKEFSSPNVSKLARADISCQSMKTASFNEWMMSVHHLPMTNSEGFQHHFKKKIVIVTWKRM